MSEPVIHDSEPVDWAELQQSAEYEKLRAAQRRFLIPASIGYLVVYFGFLVLVLNVPSLFSQPLHGGLNLGFVVMTAMFVLVWLGVLVHNAVARRRWDPLVERLRQRAAEADPLDRKSVV